MYYVKNVRYKMPNTGEEIYFEDGDIEGYYDIINWQFSDDGAISYVTVGHYNGSAAPGERMHIRNDSIVWNHEELEVSEILVSTEIFLCHVKVSKVISCMYPSLLVQCAARTVSPAQGRGSGRASQSVVLTVSHVLTEKSVTPQVSTQLCSFSESDA